MLYLISYLIGSIPLSVWLGKTIKGIDLRNHGSGATGATNSFRILGAELGIVIFLFDILKGLIVSLILFLLNIQINKIDILVLGVYSIIGHIFPIFSNLKGGKGVATTFGLISFIYPISAIISLIVFVLVFVKTNFVSLSSIISSFCVPITIFLFYNQKSLFETIFIILLPFLIVFTHRKNILRLLKQEEPKMRLGN